jgi:ribosome modulation factor
MNRDFARWFFGPSRGRKSFRPCIDVLEDRTLMDGSNFTSVALFFNLANPAQASNAGNYQATSASDVRAWLHEGESLTTSQFMHNYWSALSYGKFQVGIDAYRDAQGNIVIPTITPNQNNADDWGNIGDQIVKLDPQRIWQMSGSWTDGGKRIIPSIEVVQHYDTHSSATVGDWGDEFTAGGFTYHIQHINHVDYSLALNAAGYPDTWGGTMMHEFSHNFLNGYDLYGGGNGKIGYWDILGDDLTAGQMSDTSSYFKTQLGWITFKSVVNGPVMAATQFSVNPYATSGDAIKIVPDPVNNPKEYFLLEYRTPTSSNPWTPDGGLKESGLLITHVNERLGDAAPWVVEDSPFMDVAEADGNDGKVWPDNRAFGENFPWYDPDGNSTGQPGESTYPANNWPGPRAPGTLYPYNGNDSFTPFTNPNSNFYGGRDSGLSITNIHKVGSQMVFTVALAGNNQTTYQLSPSDQVLTGDFSGHGKTEMLAFNGHQLALIDQTENQFLTYWQANDWLGGWHFGPGDRLTAGDFNGDGKTDFFIQSNTGWAGLFLSNGQGFTQAWMSGDPAQNQNWIGGWHLGGLDQVVAGDFNGDGKTDLFIHNGGWAGLLLSTGEGFSNAWMSGDPAKNQNWIGGWHLGPNDQAFAGDFNGDGKTDLFIRNGGWAGLLISTGSGFSNVWMSGDPAQNQNWIGGWHLGPNDQVFVGDFNGDRSADLFIRNGGWAGLFLSTGTGFNNMWMSGDPAQNQNWIGGWHLGPNDQVLVGDLNGDGRDDLFIRNGPWAAHLISDGNSFHVEWIYGSLDLDNTYRQVAGRFNYDRLTDVFLFTAGKTKELMTDINSDSHQTEAQWGWDGTDRIAAKSPAQPTDQYYTADFNGDGRSDELVFNGQQLVLYANVGGTLQSEWQSGPWVGGWHLGWDDQLYIGDFNGDGKADVFIRSPHWAGLLLSTGTGFNEVWMTGDPAKNQDWIGGWHLGPNDQVFVGDFTGDGKADIFIRNGGWAGLLVSTGSGFNNLWMSGDPAKNQNWIGGWHLGVQDQVSFGDFNGDGKADIFIHNGGWAGLLISTGTGFSNVWMSGDPAKNQNWIGGWHLGPLDQVTVGDFNGDGKADIFIHNGGWAGLLISTGSGFKNVWMTGDPAKNENWIGGWHIGTLDRVAVGDFNGDGKKDLFIRSDGWAGVLVSHGTWFEAATVVPNRVGTWVFNYLDQAEVGRFSDRGHDEIFVSHPGGWTGVLTPTLSGSSLSLTLTQEAYRQITAGNPSPGPQAPVPPAHGFPSGQLSPVDLGAGTSWSEAPVSTGPVAPTDLWGASLDAFVAPARSAKSKKSQAGPTRFVDAAFLDGWEPELSTL